MQESSVQRWALLGIWVIPAFWAINYLIARVAPGIVHPHALAMGRFFIVGLVLCSSCPGWHSHKETIAESSKLSGWVTDAYVVYSAMPGTTWLKPPST